MEMNEKAWKICVGAVSAQATQRECGRHLEKAQNIPNELSQEKVHMNHIS